MADLIFPDEPGTTVNAEAGIKDGFPFKAKLPSKPVLVNKFKANESEAVLVKEVVKVPAQKNGGSWAPLNLHP